MVLWRCLSRHNRPPTKNVRPSKTEKERGRRWRMVHSGPFNGLCEIESSRGSPGISNIFLPMLELLRTTSPLSPPSLPSRLVVPPTADSCTSLPPSYVTIRRRQHTLIDLRRPDPLPRSRNFLQKLRSGCEQIFEFPWSRKHKFGRAHARRPNFFAHVYSSDNLCNACEKNGRNMRYPLRIFDS